MEAVGALEVRFVSRQSRIPGQEILFVSVIEIKASTDGIQLTMFFGHQALEKLDALLALFLEVYLLLGRRAVAPASPGVLGP